MTPQPAAARSAKIQSGASLATVARVRNGDLALRFSRHWLAATKPDIVLARVGSSPLRLACMGATLSSSSDASVLAVRWRLWAVKLLSLVAAGVVLGWAYHWAAPRLYRPESTAGFWRGTVHGALMPVALPSLLLGQDVPIYAAANTGRTYKLGYIAGINLCGLLFFGLAFRQPRRK